MASISHTALDRLLLALDLENDGEGFVGDPGGGGGRLFGGTVAAQSVVAAARTVPFDRTLHSMHAYFLRPGRHGRRIQFAVDRTRDGRSYASRTVRASQEAELIFQMTASFVSEENGISHQDPMPTVPGPGELPEREAARARVLGAGTPRFDSAVELRMCENYWLEIDKPRAARQHNWVRAKGPLPDDPLIHTAVLVYATDRSLLSTAALPHGQFFRRGGMGASLDHAVWIHRSARMDDWLLFSSESPAAHHGRSIIFGAVFRPDGTRVATIAQEALIRMPPKRS